jgi:hypothetical protein
MESRKKESINLICKRLKIARLNAGFPNAKIFAEKNFLKISTYGLHEAGTRIMSLDILKKYSRLLNIDLNWLLTGKTLKSNTVNELSLGFYTGFFNISRFKYDCGRWMNINLNSPSFSGIQSRERFVS